MKATDILAMVEAIAPSIAEALREEIAPLKERIKALEAELATRPEVPTAAEVAALVPAGKDADEAAIVAAVLKQIPDVQPLIDKALCAAPIPKDGKDADEEAIALKVLDLLPKPKDGKDADPELIGVMVAEQVEAVVKTWERPKDGKDADPEAVKTMVMKGIGDAMLPMQQACDAAITDVRAVTEAAIADLPKSEDVAELVAAKFEIDEDAIAKKVLALVPVPKDGVSVLMGDVRPELHKIAADYFAALPVPKDGADATLEQITAAVEKVLATWERPKDGASVEPATIKEMIEASVAEIPRIVQDGKDATPEQISAAVEKILATWERPKDGKSVTPEMLEEVVAKRIATIPVPKDGVGLAGGVLDRSGELILTLTDGTVRELGNVMGKDGMSIDDFEMVDGDDEFVVRLKAGDRSKEAAVRKSGVADFYRGVWSPGMHKRGSLVTWGGSLWMAQRDTEIKPETKDNDDWKLVVKRGRDGKDFTPVK